MASRIHLRIVTPEGPIFEGDVDNVLLPGFGGEDGILPNHAAMMTEIEAGELHYQDGNQTSYLAIGAGFAEIDQEHIYVLTDGAATAEDIDEDAVQKAIESAQAALSDKTLEKEDADAAQAMLARSVAQLNLKRKRRR